MLPFNADGTAVDNYHHDSGKVYALMFGYSSVYANAYYVGSYDSERKNFVPLGVDADNSAGSVSSLPKVIGSWSLANGSGASAVGPVTATATCNVTRPPYLHSLETAVLL